MGEGYKKMNVIKKIEEAKKSIEEKKLIKQRRIGLALGLSLGMIIGVTYTFDILTFREVWRGYQETLQIVNELPAWKKAHKLSEAVTPIAHADEIKPVRTNITEVMAALAAGESSNNPSAKLLNTNGTWDIGLYQINDCNTCEWQKINKGKMQDDCINSLDRFDVEKSTEWTKSQIEKGNLSKWVFAKKENLEYKKYEN